MIKQNTTYKSTLAARRFDFRKLMRSAFTAGVVGAFVGSVSGQTPTPMPVFPTGSVAVEAPCAVTLAPEQVSTSSSALRITRLLGIKKQVSPNQLPQPVSTFAFPSFPSTEPLAAKQCASEQAVLSESRAPTICHSSSGKTESVKCDQDRCEVVLASADETSFSSTNPGLEIVQSATEIDEQSADVAVSESLTESLSESLSDIEIPSSPTQAAQKIPQRIPELIKRPPAMQLHIGGNTNTVPTSPTPIQQESTFSFSDSSEVEPQKAQSQPGFANPMNVRIEGEPVLGNAVLGNAVLGNAALGNATKPQPSSPSNTVLPSTVAANATSLPKSSTEPSSRVGHKVVSDKRSDGVPAIGERLEVGLHESTNIETTHAITGLSVEHPELCQVLKSGERSVSFVGLLAGQTRVALFTTDTSGERKIEIREVMIAGAETRQADMKSLATEISRSVHNMFPSSKIEIIADAEGLTVQGYAGSEAEAKKIIGLVRRTSLQPVVDRLATYK